MKKPVLLLTALLLLVAHYALPQNYSFKHYQVDDGLSYSTVFCIMQDIDGFMWFGTKDGLNRFDGYHFKVFKYNPSYTNSLGNNHVRSLCQDKSGTIWIGTTGGLYNFDVLNEKFGFIASTIGKGVKNLTVDKNNNVWFTQNSELCSLNIYSKLLQHYPIKKYGSVTDFIITSNNVFWIANTKGQLLKFSPQINYFQCYNLFSQSTKDGDKRIERIFYTQTNQILVGTSNQGIKLFDISTGTYEDALIYNPDKTKIFARNIIYDSCDNYWIGTETGILIYNIKNRNFKRLKKDFKNSFSISDNAVYSLCKDREGGIWVGTYFGGINYYSKQNSRFEKFFPGSGQNTLTGNLVRQFCKDLNGNLWIGTEDEGLNKFNPKDGSFTSLIPTGRKTSIAYTNIHGLCAVGNEIWVGTYQHGVDVININSNKVIRHYNSGVNAGDLGSDYINYIYRTKKNQILLGTMAGLFSYQPKTDNFSRVNYVPPNVLIYDIIEDSYGKIWISTLGQGIFCYNPSYNTTQHYKFDSKNDKSLSSDYVTSAFIDKDLEIWFTTENGGLSKFNYQTRNFDRYNITDGDDRPYLYNILEDSKETFWISTSNGLIKFNKITHHYSKFTKEDGLLSNQFNYNSSFKDSLGRLYFGSLKGFIRFYPFDTTKTETNNHKVFITGFQVDNNELISRKNNSSPQRSILHTETVYLKYNQNSFSIDFAAPNFTAPKTVQYAYILENFDKNRTYLSANRKIFFTKVAPGNYTFKITAININGNWITPDTTLYIEIAPPFYASFWAFLLYGSLIILVIFFAFKYYHRYIKNLNQKRVKAIEAEKRKEIYEAKIEFFTHITHEIRTPLTLIKGPLEKLKELNNNPLIEGHLSLMERNANRLFNLVDQLLDFRRTEKSAYTLNFRRHNINQALLNNYSLFKDIAEKHNFIYEINVPYNCVYAYVDVEALNKIMSNLLDNAIKYAKSKIVVALIEYSENFEIDIKSDGTPIPTESKEKIFDAFFRLNKNRDKTGTGIGLSLSRSLVELHKGQLTLIQTEPNLNTFRIFLPLHQTQEFDLEFDDKEDLSNDLPEENLVINEDKPAILIVEDNKEIIFLVAEELKAEFLIFTANNGQQALTIIKNHVINLIISDIMMPVMDGLQLCRIIKTDINYSHIPIILLTAVTNDQSKLNGLECGADAYVQKPYSPKYLKSQVNNLLNSREKLKEYYARTPLIHIKSIAHSTADESFLKRVDEIIKLNLDNIDLNIEMIADLMNMSRPTFFRKIKAIANITPNELIIITRLKRAAELIREKNMKIYEIADIVGFKSSSTFVKAFQRQFKMTPTRYAVGDDDKR